ncbi:hypothetical protein ABZ468_35340 [Streptomyces sp. NPDC005708]|uniref:hypothetical protein n=1 Tax=Streptomyces sp. NPDC005708 TaxID=3154564 RepID=UPI0033F5E107
MTTLVQAPSVTARITPDSTIPGAPTTVAPTGPAAYTVIVLVNVAKNHYDGYQVGHHVAEVTATEHDTTPLALVFHAAPYTKVDAVADAAWVVGNRMGADDAGQTWPRDVRSVSKGDVLAVTAPDGTTVHLCVGSTRFSPAEPPMPHCMVPLAGTDASSRRT